MHKHNPNDNLESVNRTRTQISRSCLHHPIRPRLISVSHITSSSREYFICAIFILMSCRFFLVYLILVCVLFLFFRSVASNNNHKVSKQIKFINKLWEIIFILNQYLTINLNWLLFYWTHLIEIGQRLDNVTYFKVILFSFRLLTSTSAQWFISLHRQVW